MIRVLEYHVGRIALFHEPGKIVRYLGVGGGQNNIYVKPRMALAA